VQSLDNSPDGGLRGGAETETKWERPVLMPYLAGATVPLFPSLYLCLSPCFCLGVGEVGKGKLERAGNDPGLQGQAFVSILGTCGVWPGCGGRDRLLVYSYPAWGQKESPHFREEAFPDTSFSLLLLT
jgi:hypothetical protein